MISVRRYAKTSINKKISYKALVSFIISLFTCSLLIAVTAKNKSDIDKMTMELLIIEKSIAINDIVSKLLYKTHIIANLVIQSNGEIEKFGQIAASIVDNPAILNILVAPDGVVSDIYPLQGNEGALQLDFFSEGAGNKEAQLAKEMNTLVFGGPFTLRQGGQALVGRLPVWVDTSEGHKRFWGLVSVTLKYPQVLEGAGLETLIKQGMVYEIWRVNPDDGQKQTIAGSSRIDDGNLRFLEERIRIHNADWYFRLAPVRYWYSYSETWILGVAGIFVSFLIAVIMQNNCDLSDMKDDLEVMVRTDPLTGLLNRKGLFHTLEALAQSGERFLLFYLDLNYFKQINDTYGHGIGDLVLRGFSDKVRKHMSGDCIFARISGDEFVLVMRGGDREKAEKFWKAVDREFASPLLTVSGNDISLTFSRGLAVFPDDADSLDQLISCADKEMYTQKRSQYTKEKRRRTSDWAPEDARV